MKSASFLTVVAQGLGLGVVGYTVFDSFFDILTFTGPSMEPTIRENDIGFGEKLTSFKKLQRCITGDIVTVISPDSPSTSLCKRIIGLEGDKVSYSRKNPTPCSDDEGWEESIHIRRFVPRGHIWLEGDNSDLSYDSRAFGPIPLALVRSRVFAKIYPRPTWLKRESKQSSS